MMTTSGPNRHRDRYLGIASIETRGARSACLHVVVVFEWRIVKLPAFQQLLDRQNAFLGECGVVCFSSMVYRGGVYFAGSLQSITSRGRAWENDLVMCR